MFRHSECWYVIAFFHDQSLVDLQQTWEMLSGELLFGQDDEQEVLRRIVDLLGPPPADLLRDNTKVFEALKINYKTHFCKFCIFADFIFQSATSIF
jgi:hypothetical protein